MTNPKGTIAETALVRWARGHGFPQADRLTKTGAKDRGDVGLCPGVIVEVKNHLSSGKRGPTPEQAKHWMKETEVERQNANAAIGILLVKREGTTDVGRWYAYMEAHSFARLLLPLGPWMVSAPAGAYCAPVCLAMRDLATILNLAGYGSALRLCPECQAGKHGNCDGTAWNDAADDIDVCQCPEPSHG